MGRFSPNATQQNWVINNLGCLGNNLELQTCVEKMKTNNLKPVLPNFFKLICSSTHFLKNGRVGEGWSKKWHVVSCRYWHLDREKHIHNLLPHKGAYRCGRLEQNQDNVPYIRHCQNRHSPPAPQHRHAGSWRQSCLAQMECSRLETRWLRCHFLCAFSSVTVIKEKR